MPVKIKLPKRYYTVEQLAERWECRVEDINHLIEIHALKMVPMIAGYLGPQYNDLLLMPFQDKATMHLELSKLGEEYRNYVVWPAVPEPGETMEDAIDRERRWLHENDYFREVITASEIYRFEREYGQPTDDTAPPPSWPWGDYDTPLLRILAEAVDHFCVSNAEGYPGKECGEVVNWIKDRMQENGMPTSGQLASAIETLIAPRPYVHHRQRKQK